MLESAIAEIAAGLVVKFTASEAGIRKIEWAPFPVGPSVTSENSLIRGYLAEARTQLRAYFAGDLREFDLSLDLRGSDFQLRVWRSLCAIPFGETRSYAEIAVAIGAPKAVRAVGAANGANPIPIIVPCHRVIGSSGRLVGYGGGLLLKKRLLELESGTSLFASLERDIAERVPGKHATDYRPVS